MAAPVISGVVTAGQTLTAVNASANAWRWFRGDSDGDPSNAISGATSQTYTVTALDELHGVFVDNSEDGGSTWERGALLRRELHPSRVAAVVSRLDPRDMSTWTGSTPTGAAGTSPGAGLGGVDADWEQVDSAPDADGRGHAYVQSRPNDISGIQSWWNGANGVIMDPSNDRVLLSANSRITAPSAFGGEAQDHSVVLVLAELASAYTDPISVYYTGSAPFTGGGYAQLSVGQTSLMPGYRSSIGEEVASWQSGVTSALATTHDSTPRVYSRRSPISAINAGDSRQSGVALADPTTYSAATYAAYGADETSVGNTDAAGGRHWCLGLIRINSVTDADLEWAEGWLAWTTGSTLDASHPYAAAPAPDNLTPPALAAGGSIVDASAAVSVGTTFVGTPDVVAALAVSPGAVPAGAATGAADVAISSPLQVAPGPVPAAAATGSADVTIETGITVFPGAVSASAATGGADASLGSPLSAAPGIVPAGAATGSTDVTVPTGTTVAPGSVPAGASTGGADVALGAALTVSPGAVAEGASTRGADVQAITGTIVSPSRVPAAAATGGADVGLESPLAVSPGTVLAGATTGGADATLGTPLSAAPAIVPAGAVTQPADALILGTTVAPGRVPAGAATGAADTTLAASLQVAPGRVPSTAATGGADTSLQPSLAVSAGLVPAAATTGGADASLGGAPLTVSPGIVPAGAVTRGLRFVGGTYRPGRTTLRFELEPLRNRFQI